MADPPGRSLRDIDAELAALVQQRGAVSARQLEASLARAQAIAAAVVEEDGVATGEDAGDDAAAGAAAVSRTSNTVALAATTGRRGGGAAASAAGVAAPGSAPRRAAATAPASAAADRASVLAMVDEADTNDAIMAEFMEVTDFERIAREGLRDKRTRRGSRRKLPENGFVSTKLPPELKAVIEHANAAFVDARYLDAEALLQRVVRESPRHVQALLTLSSVCEALGKSAEALAFMKRASSIDIGNAELAKLVAVRFKDTGNLRACIVHFARAVRAVPTDIEALSDLAAVQEEAGQSKAALRTLRQLVLQPAFTNVPAAFVRMAAISFKDGDMSGCRSSLISGLDYCLGNVPETDAAGNVIGAGGGVAALLRAAAGGEGGGSGYDKEKDGDDDDDDDDDDIDDGDDDDDIDGGDEGGDEGDDVEEGEAESEEAGGGGAAAANGGYGEEGEQEGGAAAAAAPAPAAPAPAAPTGPQVLYPQYQFLRQALDLANMLCQLLRLDQAWEGTVALIERIKRFQAAALAAEAAAAEGGDGGDAARPRLPKHLPIDLDVHLGIALLMRGDDTYQRHFSAVWRVPPEVHLDLKVLITQSMVAKRQASAAAAILTNLLTGAAAGLAARPALARLAQRVLAEAHLQLGDTAKALDARLAAAALPEGEEADLGVEDPSAAADVHAALLMLVSDPPRAAALMPDLLASKKLMGACFPSATLPTVLCMFRAANELHAAITALNPPLVERRGMAAAYVALLETALGVGYPGELLPVRRRRFRHLVVSVGRAAVSAAMRVFVAEYELLHDASRTLRLVTMLLTLLREAGAEEAAAAVALAADGEEGDGGDVPAPHDFLKGRLIGLAGRKRGRTIVDAEAAAMLGVQLQPPSVAAQLGGIVSHQSHLAASATGAKLLDLLVALLQHAMPGIEAAIVAAGGGGLPDALALGGVSGLTSELQASRAITIMFQFAMTYPYHVGLWNLVWRVAVLLGGGNILSGTLHRALARRLGSRSMSLPLLMMTAHHCLSTGTTRLALGLYFEAFRLAPRDPLVALCIAASFFALLPSRTTENRHAEAVRGVAFFSLYRDLRRAQAQEAAAAVGDAGSTVEGYLYEVEALTNLGRVCHQLLLTSAAVACYGDALAVVPPPCLAPDSPTPPPPELAPLARGVKRDAAYNYALLLEKAGQAALAEAVIAQHLTLD